MSDTYVKKEGFLSRMKSAVGGIFFGIILVIVGIGLLIWNEKKSINNINDLKEMQDIYVEVKSDEVDSKNNEKLIVTSGKLTYGDVTLSDTAFNVSANTPKLVRTVEVYQWTESSSSNDGETTYTYNKEWSSTLVDSSNFYHTGGHENPTSKAYEDKTESAKEISVGAFKLDNEYRDIISASERITDLSQAIVPEGYQVVDGYITNVENTSKPNVGDVRISFSYAKYDEVTVLGTQYQGAIIPYKAKSGKSIYKLYEGKHDAAYIFDKMAKGNKLLRWGLRLLGTLLIIIGISALFGPITTLTSYVPILGSLVNGATGLVSFLVGLIISLVVIAISWIAFRPILAVGLIALAVIFVILLKKLPKKEKQVAPQVVQQPVAEPTEIPQPQPQPVEQPVEEKKE